MRSLPAKSTKCSCDRTMRFWGMTLCVRVMTNTVCAREDRSLTAVAAYCLRSSPAWRICRCNKMRCVPAAAGGGGMTNLVGGDEHPRRGAPHRRATEMRPKTAGSVVSAADPEGRAGRSPERGGGGGAYRPGGVSKRGLFWPCAPPTQTICCLRKTKTHRKQETSGLGPLHSGPGSIHIRSIPVSSRPRKNGKNGKNEEK